MQETIYHVRTEMRQSLIYLVWMVDYLEIKSDPDQNFSSTRVSQ